MVLLIAGIAAIATAAGAVWGLEKVDSGLTTIEDNTQGIADDLRVVRGASGVAGCFEQLVLFQRCLLSMMT